MTALFLSKYGWISWKEAKNYSESYFFSIRLKMGNPEEIF